MAWTSEDVRGFILSEVNRVISAGSKSSKKGGGYVTREYVPVIKRELGYVRHSYINELGRVWEFK